jgi:hypothetical protein
MYTWVDKAGNAHYSDQPGDPEARRLAQEDLPPVTETNQAPSSDLVPQKTLLPGEFTVRGRLLFDGKPLSSLTSAAVVVHIYNRELKKWITPDYTYDAGSGTFQLKGVPSGPGNGEVRIDADGSNPAQYPGDYRGRFNFTPGPTAQADVSVDMERMLHLTSPEDNAAPLANWGGVCQNKIGYETPVAIAWEPLGKDVSYSYTIIRTVCRPFAVKNTVVADRTTEPRAVLGLPPNEEGEFYLLRLEARKDNRPVGSLMTHGPNGYAWDYRFRVLPKRKPTRMISPLVK